jgi:hypothetical protein
MKKLFFLLTAFWFVACQQPKKQYFEASPEIDSVKKSFHAFLSQDWDTFRSIYADSAKIATNTSDSSKFVNVDQFIIKENYGMGIGYNHGKIHKIDDDAVYSMFITDKGEKWVLLWFNFSSKILDSTKTGYEDEFEYTPEWLTSARHDKFLFVDGKVVFQNIYCYTYRRDSQDWDPGNREPTDSIIPNKSLKQ